MGLPPDQLALMISTIFFTSGLCTLIQQSPLGNKLPVIQGGTFSFLGPTFAILGLCTAELATSAGLPLWQLKIQMVAGAIMVASVVEIVLGYTGIMGQVRKIISPIVIGPTIAMIGLALFNIGAPWMAGNWIVSLITLTALILYSQVFSHKSKVFMLFPVLLQDSKDRQPVPSRALQPDPRAPGPRGSGLRPGSSSALRGPRQPHRCWCSDRSGDRRGSR